MTKLRLLQINNVELEGDLKLLPSELKWIQWKGCPLENLPPDFHAHQLAVLDLSESGIRRIHILPIRGVDGTLKVLNLRGCYNLDTIPDLSNHKALEKLVLEQCNLLVKVPSSVGNLGTLLHLDLRDCSKLAEFLVDVSGLKHLEKLVLSGCSDLSVLPKNIGDMKALKELLLDNTAIKDLPGSIYRLQNLEKLSLRGCRFIQELPSCIATLTSLEKLYLDDTGLKNLPCSIGDLKNLQKLHLMRCTFLSEIPDSINELTSLKELVINGSGVRGWYGQGSIIVITTGDEEILSSLSVNHLYEVNCLNEMQALKLFSYHPLRKEKPTENLSKKIVEITGHLPLAVEVFGSLLYDKKERKQWQAQLEKLKNTQPNDLQMHGIHLVYDGDDDFRGEEKLLTETQLSVSQKLTNFFSSFEEGEASSVGESTVS